MSKYPKASWWMILLLISTQSGCLSTIKNWTSSKQVKTTNAKRQPISKEKTLPIDESAQLSEATGEEMEKKGFHGEAIRYYEQARRLDSSRTHLTRRLGVLYAKLGNSARANAEYVKALSVTPDDPGLLNDLGYSHYQNGNLAEAEKALRKAVEIDPDYQRAKINLALVLVRQGKDQESLSTFLEVLPPPHAHYNVGVALAQQGEMNKARQLLKHSLSLNPNLQKARVVLAKLESMDESHSAIEQASTAPSLAK